MVNMESDLVWVDFDFMEQFMVDVFVKLGASYDDAKICADVIITSDKRGIDSHGVNRLKPMYYDRIKAGTQVPTAKYEIIRENSTTAVIEGNRGMGHATAKHAMELAIKKATEHGLGMVVVRNNTHYGIAGYYVTMATEAGMIGITGTNARPAVAPTYGVEPMLGTNPFTIGMPTDEEFSFILDPATSIIQRGKVEVYARTGAPLPEGLVIDSNGEYMTDPNLILEKLSKKEASLLPIGSKAETGGYKGYGYSTVVEILSSALQGGAFLQAITGVNVGHFFIAINIEAFTDLASFKKTSGDILRTLRSSKRMPSESRIYTAGEKEHLAWLERKDKGVPINLSIQEELLEIRDELGLKTRFPFESD